MTKTIYIILTRSNTIMSKTICKATGDKYSHVSICFDRDLREVYSSSRKNGETPFPAGPCKENFRHGIYIRNKAAPCSVYAIEVDKVRYQLLRTELQRVVNFSEYYGYNYIGLLLLKLGICFETKRHYFCSQFVSEMFKRAGIIELPKEPSLMRPMDYAGLEGLDCVYEGCIGDLLKEKIPR